MPLRTRIPIKLTIPNTAVTLTSSPITQMPRAAPNRHNEMDPKTSNAILIRRKWNSKIKNITTIEINRPLNIISNISLSASSLPPTSKSTPSGKSIFSIAFTISLVNAAALEPSFTSDCIEIEGIPLRCAIWASCQSGSMSAICLTGTETVPPHADTY